MGLQTLPWFLDDILHFSANSSNDVTFSFSFLSVAYHQNTLNEIEEQLQKYFSLGQVDLIAPIKEVRYA